MPYAIPANIRYEEKLLGPLTVKQTAYVGIGASIIGFLYFASDFPDEIKMSVSAVTALLTIGFAMFNLDVWLSHYISFMKTSKKTSWISPAARELMNIRSIRADAVFLKDHRVLGLLKVTPINFGVLSRGDQDTVIYGFLEFLNSLNFSIQVVMRSVNLDLSDYLIHLRRRITQRDDKVALAYFEHFAEYMRAYIDINKINDRHFYIVVPAEKQKTEHETIMNLETRCSMLHSTLSISGIVSERQSTHQLINFYSSYFTETFEIYQSYISPITMYRKMWKHAPKKSSLADVVKDKPDPAPAKAEAKEPVKPKEAAK